jgi:hypothetical protein
MAAKKAGRNGLVYVGGTEITYGNAWEINPTQGSAEGAHFGQGWVDREAGIKDWSGSISAWHDQDSKVLYSATVAGAACAILIYPDRSDLGTYWSGDALFTSMRSSGAMEGMVAQTADFSGAGSLTATGFS